MSSVSFSKSNSVVDHVEPKPFVKWVGGKRQLLKQFKEKNLFPREFNERTNTYYEPFVGGGAVFFELLPMNAVLSDLNIELVTTYNVIKNQVEELIASLRKHIYEKEYFLKVRAWQVEELSDVEIASRFIYLNRTCFNGVYRVNKKGQFNVPFGRYKNPRILDEYNLLAVSRSLKDIDIRKQSFEVVLESAKKGDFIYFDPPYFPINKTSSFTSYTKEDFLEEDQTRLKEIFLRLNEKGCFIMLSNSDTEFINSLYSGYKNIRINKVRASRAINSKAEKRGYLSEVVVTNY